MSVGQQFDFDRFPQAQRGGMRVYAFGGVLSGLEVGTIAYAAGNLTIPYTAGVVKLDGLKFSISSGSIVRALGNGTHVLNMFVNPTREVPVSTTVPSGAPSAPNNNYAIQVVDYGDYQQVLNYYKYENAAWSVHDPIFDPPTLDYGNLFHNRIVGATVGTSPEKQIYQKLASAPFLSQPAPHIARYSTSLLVAQVTAVVSGGALASSEVKRYEVQIPM